MEKKADKNHFLGHGKRIAQLRLLTNSQTLQKYYQFGMEISEQEQLAFMLEGGVQWESDQPEGINFSGINLKSKLYDPVGKHFFANPVTSYRQSKLGLYEIAGLIETKFDVTDIDESLESISNSVEKIALLNATISFQYDARIDWKPARNLKFEGRSTDYPKPEKDEGEFWDVVRGHTELT